LALAGSGHGSLAQIKEDYSIAPNSPVHCLSLVDLYHSYRCVHYRFASVLLFRVLVGLQHKYWSRIFGFDRFDDLSVIFVVIGGFPSAQYRDITVH